MKKSKTGKGRKDKFYFLAKETDLCAAPGGWLQVAAKEMPVASQIIGIDLVPITQIPHVKTFTTDITTDKCRQLLRNELNKTKADVFLHDGAPNVGTAWSIDEFSQATLCLQAFALATEFLRKGGWFVTKVFRSRDYEPLKWVLSQFFKFVRAVKPEASRIESAEIFLIGQNYRAPDRIDPKFLDVKHVFGEVDQPKDRSSLVSSLFKQPKRNKRAEGYADGDKLYSELPVSQFIESADPLEALAQVNKVVFDNQDIQSHPLTTSEVVANLDDIKVLGKGDIKNVLKWRKKIRLALGYDSAPDPTAPDQKPDAVDTATEDPEQAVQRDIDRLLGEEAKQEKKRLKAIRLSKIKLAKRLVLQMDQQADDRIEQTDANELFSLASLDKLLQGQANQLIDGNDMGIDALARSRQMDQVTARRVEMAQLERLAIEGRRSVAFDRRQRGDGDNQALLGFDTVGKGSRDDIYLPSSDDDESEASEDLADPPPPARKARLKRRRDEEPLSEASSSKPWPLLSSSKTNSKSNGGGLLLDLDDADEEVKKRRKIDNWMASGELQNLLNIDEIGQPLSDDEKAAVWSDGKKQSQVKTSQKLVKKEKKKPDQEDGQANKTGSSNHQRQQSDQVEKNGEEGKEDSQPTSVVAKSQQRRLRRPLTSEEQALAIRLIKSAKSRRDLVESSYHRMQFFDDPSTLPDWFVEEEEKHMRKPLPIDKSELPTERPTAGRSLKKAEEAKARKKSRLAKRLKRVRRKADEIDEDIPESEKWQKIKQMYKKAGLLGKKRRPVHTIVNTKGGGGSRQKPAPKGAKVKIVDRRLKADLRGGQRGTKLKKRSRKSGKPIPVGGRKRSAAGKSYRRPASQRV